jgi:hypothetical protein
MEMKTVPHTTRHRWLAWRLSVVVALVFIAEVLSWMHPLSARCGGWFMSATCGHVSIVQRREVDGSSWTFYTPYSAKREIPTRLARLGVLPEYGNAPYNGQYLFIPFWIPAAMICLLIIVRARRKHFPSAAWYCSACRYDLTGNTSGACPECGAASVASSVDP